MFCMTQRQKIHPSIAQKHQEWHKNFPHYVTLAAGVSVALVDGVHINRSLIPLVYQDVED